MKVNFSGKERQLSGEPYQVNQHFNHFKGVDQAFNEIRSADLKGVKLILGIPSVDTSVCSMELNKLVQATKNKEMHLISISMDLPFALNRWCQINAAKHLIALSDYKDHAFALTSGTMMDEVGLLARTAFVVDENDMVRYAEVVYDTGKEPNYEAILQTLQELLVN